MAIRTILAPVSGGTGSDRVLDLALMIGRHFGAHVEILHVALDPREAVPLVGEGMSGSMVEEIVQLAEKEMHVRSAAARDLFDERVAKFSIPTAESPPAPSGGVSVAWRQEVGREDEVVATRGRVFDLIVVGRPGGDSDQPSETTLEAALMESGRPLIVAPPDPVDRVGETVAIAWNGSTEAARSCTAALPLLVAAKRVVVLGGDGAATAAGASSVQLAEQLAWHGVTAEVRRFASDDKGIGAALLGEAQAAGVDLLVMGGYGHSRLRQMIFGGATSHMLYAASLPLLMTH